RVRGRRRACPTRRSSDLDPVVGLVVAQVREAAVGVVRVDAVGAVVAAGQRGERAVGDAGGREDEAVGRVVAVRREVRGHVGRVGGGAGRRRDGGGLPAGR